MPLTSARIGELRRWLGNDNFDQLDPNGDGGISADELRLLLDSQGGGLHEQMWAYGGIVALTVTTWLALNWFWNGPKQHGGFRTVVRFVLVAVQWAVELSCNLFCFLDLVHPVYCCRSY